MDSWNEGSTTASLGDSSLCLIGCKENTGSVKRKYTEQPKVKKAKYEDLQTLKRVLPQDFHSFYDALPHYT